MCKTDRIEGRNSSTTIVGDFNTVLILMDRATRQKISKKIEDLNSTINKLDLIDDTKQCTQQQ